MVQYLTEGWRRLKVHSSEVYTWLGDGKESACNAGDSSLIPGSEKSLGERNGNPTLVFLSGEFHGPWSLTGCSPWGCKESDTT